MNIDTNYDEADFLYPAPNVDQDGSLSFNSPNIFDTSLNIADKGEAGLEAEGEPAHGTNGNESTTNYNSTENPQDDFGTLGIEDMFNANLSSNLPGAFKDTDDYMDLDDSPPFTVEQDVFYASTNSKNSPEVLEINARQTLFPHNQYFNRQFRQDHSPSFVSPNSLSQNVNTPNPPQQLHFDTPSASHSISNLHLNGSTRSFAQYETNHLDEASVYSSFLNENESIPDNHLRNPSIDSHFAPAIPFQVAQQQHDLSPLTTTTSLTPSVNSIHSTQPSFFSAHQYLPRQSIDLTNSNRNSVDFMSKARNSIDSSASSQIQQLRSNNSSTNNRYLSFTNSISSYIPFMGDKNSQATDRSPISGPPSPVSKSVSSFAFMNLQPSPRQQATPRQQPRHLIRSIFKSNPNTSNGEVDPLDEEVEADEFKEAVNTFNPEIFLLSPQKDDEPEDLLNKKKPKKAKRGLFNRFKTPVKQDDDEEEIAEAIGKQSVHNSFDEEVPENGFQANMSRTPSSANTINNSLELSILNHNQPDYAALFENFGKRKKIGKNTSFKNKPPKVKIERLDEDLYSESSHNGDSINNPKQLLESSSTSATSQSQHQEEIETDPSTASNSLASASKRILGSKLIKRKTPLKEPDIKSVRTKVVADGVELEVDLKTLDIPETEEAAAANFQNNRIRGRKENKQADMVDTSKIFVCNYCSRRFKRQEHLRRHFKSLHTFDKPYDCSICHKKFSRSDNYNQHLKTQHGKEKDEV